MYESSIYAKGETKHSESIEDAILSELSPSQERSFDLTRFITDCNSPSPLNLLSTDPRLPDTSLEASERLEGTILAAVVTTSGADQPSFARTSQSFGDHSCVMPTFEWGNGGGGDEVASGGGGYPAMESAVATVGQPWSDLVGLFKSESHSTYAQLSPAATTQAPTASCSTVDSGVLRPPSSVSPHFGMVSPSLSNSSAASAQQTSAEYPTSGETSGRRSRTTSTGSGKSRSSRKRQLEKGTPEYQEKRARNNVAVRKSRLKSKQKQRDTEARVNELVTENEQLHKKVDLLTKELTVLKGLFVNVGAPLPADLTSLLDS